MTTDLESLLTGYKHWRDIGNRLLIGGLIAEVFISAAIAEHRKYKWLAELLAAVIVLVGVWVEVQNGGYADDIERQIRQQSDEKIADLNKEAKQLSNAEAQARLAIAEAQKETAQAEERAESAKEQATRLLRAFVTPKLFIDPKEFPKLQKFAGTPFLAQGLPPVDKPAPNETTDTFRARQEASSESYMAAGSFGQLQEVGWKPWVPPANCRWSWGSMLGGITVWSWRPEPHTMLHLQTPFEMSLDTPEGKAWAAGEALTLYLQAEGVQNITHIPLLANMMGPRGPEICPGISVPKGLVVIAVGQRIPVDFRWFEEEEGLRERGPYPPPLEQAK